MVIIVGAGITGLSAAFELTLRGVPFRVIEASPRAGGLIRTDRTQDFLIEAGPESVLAQKPAALALCEALGLTSRIVTSTPPRTAFVLKRGRLYPLPSPSVLGVPLTLGAVAGYELLPPCARLRLAIEPLVPGRRQRDESVGSFFRRRFGPATVGLIAEPLLGGIHAGDVESLSMRSLFPRFLDADARSGSVIRAFRHVAAARDGGLFRSLAGGMGEMVEALERRLPEGSTQFGAPVRELARTAAGAGRPWSVRTDRGITTADAVLLAVPAYVAAALLEPIDAEAASHCAAVSYASSVSVTLAWPRASVAHPLQGSGFVVARKYNANRITACTWVSSKWPGRAPAGTVLLRAFLGGSHDPGTVDLDDEALVRIVVHDLAPILGITGPPRLSSIARWRLGGAQHAVGHEDRIDRIEARLAAHPGVFVAGSGFRSVGIPDCITDGRAAALRALECTMIGGSPPPAAGHDEPGRPAPPR